MHLNPPAQATAPFYRHLAAVTGARRETGASASRALSLSVRCCVLGGNPVDAATGSGAPSDAREYSVSVRQADWPDHLPPQTGDVVAVDGFPSMRVLSVVPASQAWTMTCHSLRGA